MCNLPDEKDMEVIDGFDTDIRKHIISTNPAPVSKTRFATHFFDAEPTF